MKARIACCALLALSLGQGCQLVGGFEDFEAAPPGAGGEGGTGGTDGGGSGGGQQPPSCPDETAPGEHGPEMAQVMREDESCFWIDSTEVTVEQYAEFLAEPSHAVQEPACAENAAFEPTADCLADAPGTGDSLPVTCVDYCDALAFCVWAGKDLCKDDTSSANEQSDWYQACTGGEPANHYSCEEPCDVSDCNGSSSGIGSVQPVGTVTGCVVPSHKGPDVSDLSGNVQEWTSYCSLGSADAPCNTRGGFHDASDNALQCVTVQSVARNIARATLGFRCCKDAAGSGGE